MNNLTFIVGLYTYKHIDFYATVVVYITTAM